MSLEFRYGNPRVGTEKVWRTPSLIYISLERDPRAVLLEVSNFNEYTLRRRVLNNPLLNNVWDSIDRQLEGHFERESFDVTTRCADDQIVMLPPDIETALIAMNRLIENEAKLLRENAPCG